MIAPEKFGRIAVADVLIVNAPDGSLVEAVRPVRDVYLVHVCEDAAARPHVALALDRIGVPIPGSDLIEIPASVARDLLDAIADDDAAALAALAMKCPRNDTHN